MAKAEYDLSDSWTVYSALGGQHSHEIGTYSVVFAVVRQRRDEIYAADIDAHRTAVERFLLIAEIERGAETIATVIKPQRSQRGTDD
jgi:hypothetical protein